MEKVVQVRATLKNCLCKIVCLLQHVEVPVPTPTKGEVLLKLEAASINPIDWKIQKGMLRPFLPRKFPYAPGNFCFSWCLIKFYSVELIDKFTGIWSVSCRWGEVWGRYISNILKQIMLLYCETSCFVVCTLLFVDIG